MTHYLDVMQSSARKKLGNLRAGALFMKMGTGKTKVALEIAGGHVNDYDSIIWIAPASLIRSDDYIKEIYKWHLSDCKIHFYSVESIGSSDRLFMNMIGLAEKSRVFCIVDESLTIKNAHAKRTARLARYYNKFDFRLILNGTPVTRSILDLHMQMNFLHPKILNMSESQFANHFMQYDKTKGYQPWRRWSRPENEAALIEMIRPYVFCADLELKTGVSESDKDFMLSPQERADYEQFKRDYLGSNPFPQFLPVSQAFQHFYTMTEKKLEWISHKAKNATNPLLVFVKFHKEIDQLKKIFNFVECSGRSSDPHLTEKFKDLGIMVSTYGTGSFGHNWQFCSDMVCLSGTFDYAHVEHGLHRIKRAGQSRDISLTHCWVNTGNDRLMRESLNKKSTTLSNIKGYMTPEQVLEL